MTRWGGTTPCRRMSGMLGLSLKNSPNHVLVPTAWRARPPISSGLTGGESNRVMPDGTQIWRIFHNGVDTHTIHTHLFHTQLINRVDQSGQIVGILWTRSSWAGKTLSG